MRPEILFPLFAPLTSLKGVGPRLLPMLERVSGPIVRDLLFVRPTGLVERPLRVIADAADAGPSRLLVEIVRHWPSPRPQTPWRALARDASGEVELLWFKGGGVHLGRALPPGAQRLLIGEVRRSGDRLSLAHPEWRTPPERCAAEIEREPIYPTTAGLSSRILSRFIKQAVERAADLPEWLDAGFQSREGLPAWRVAIGALHAPRSVQDLGSDGPCVRRLAYDELFAHQLALQTRKRARGRERAQPVSPDSVSGRVEAGLGFRLTGDQRAALADIRKDMASGFAMSRLVQGDVGSGKTAVAALALADAAGAGLQGALMAPTEILARQHAERLTPLFAQAGLNVVCVTGRDRTALRRAAADALATGAAHVAIGTHALIQEEIRFHRLGLAVIDEQHRFGVAERARLAAKGTAVHLLAMSATPIPRTLELTLFGDQDVSRIQEKPPGRKPIVTRLVPMAREDEVVERLAAALGRGAQAYWICPLVADSEETDLAAATSRLIRLRERLGTAVALVHGQMPTAEKDAAMADFLSGRAQVLVATTVVEVGVDAPSATIMIIEQAERFGLAQLHQLRGRVGRGDRDSACVLLYGGPLGETGRRRLEALRETEDGFALAETDWALRGGGDLVGLKQSGLPDYRFADLSAHRDLLFAAAQDARLLLSADPDLSGSRGRAARILCALFDWGLDVGARSA